MTTAAKKQRIVDAIKSHNDFPKPGIVFRDIFPVLRNHVLFEDTIQLFLNEVKKNCPKADVVVGLESRGFLFAPLIALRLHVPFVPIRKAGKLPGDKHSLTYSLEYGTDTIELAQDSIKEGQKVVVIDDLLATGGTMKASVELLEKTKAQVQGCGVVIELEGLKGRNTIPVKCFSLFKF